MEKVQFRNIKSFIIERLNEAKGKIRIAVAWFTNDELYQAILLLLDKGIQVDLIIIDDHINRNEFGLDFNVFISKGGHLYFSTNAKNMHNKFCVIDTNKVITGSYNWTYYAENRNWENIIESNEESIADLYANEFDAIKAKLPEVTNYSQLKLEEADPIILLNEYDYLYQDLCYKGNITGIEYSDFLSAIKDNITIEKKSNTIVAHITHPESFSAHKSVTLHSLGIRCIIDGKANSTSVIIPKGTEIPCEMNGVYLTSVDNQTSMGCETLLGENVDANQNRSIGKIILNDIPPLPKGQGKIEVAFKITPDRVLHVKTTNLHTRTYIEASYYLNNTI
jgi:hypothetical protein